MLTTHRPHPDGALSTPRQRCTSAACQRPLADRPLELAVALTRAGGDVTVVGCCRRPGEQVDLRLPAPMASRSRDRDAGDGSGLRALAELTSPQPS